MSKERKCIICSESFIVKYPSCKRKTCTKKCKNELTRHNMLEYNRKNPDIAKRNGDLLNGYKSTKKYKSAMDKRDFSGENHPSYGMERSPEWRKKIGDANRGKFKGMTWEEMYGSETTSRRKKENSISMSSINETLLNDRTSNLEKKIAQTLVPLGYKQNKQVGKYTVDFIRNKEIVEVYGDFWHCNPKVYNKDYFNKCINMSAKEKWQYDETRSQYLKDRGYTVMILWEMDLKENYLC